MSIVELHGPPSWSFDASDTGESTKCPCVGVVEDRAGGKNRETVTASETHQCLAVEAFDLVNCSLPACWVRPCL